MTRRLNVEDKIYIMFNSGWGSLIFILDLFSTLVAGNPRSNIVRLALHRYSLALFRSPHIVDRINYLFNHHDASMSLHFTALTA